MSRSIQWIMTEGQRELNGTKMKRMIALTLVFVIMSLLLSGCWDAVPIEDRSIATALAIDLVEPGSTVLVLTSLLLSPAKEATERSFVVSGVGETVAQTREDRQRQTATRVLFGQLQMVIICDHVATMGIGNILDYFIRFARISHTTHVAVCGARASNLLSLTSNERYDIGQHLEALTSKTTFTIPLPSITMHELMYDIITPHHRAVLPYMVIENGRPALRGLALFRGDQLVKIVEDEDAAILSMLRYSDVYGSHPFEYQAKGKTYLASMEGASARKVIANYEQGRWSFVITLKFKGNLIDKAAQDGLKDPDETQQLLESSLERHMEQQANELVRRLQTETRLDALNLAKYALAKGRDRLDGVDWDEQFAKADITVKVTVNMLTMGEGM